MKATLDALELGAVRELEATHAVKAVGWASTQDFVTCVAGGHKGTGPATARLAKAVDEPVLVPVGEALAEGWLSTAKAHVIERAIGTLPGNPELRERGVQALLVEAQALDATELRRLAVRLLAIVDPDGDERRAEKALDKEERAAHLGRFLGITDDGAGGAWIKGRCSSEDAATLKSTLMPLAKPHPSATPRVTITMDLEDLKKQSGFGASETGAQLSASAVRWMCCDAEIIPVVLGSAAEVLDVGRLQRLVTAAIWKALVARDAHCRFKRCTRPPVMCHAHHLLHWADGGATSLDNLVLLCGHHHRLIHAGPWTIRRTRPNGYAFDPPPGIRRRTGRPPPDG